MTASGIRVVNIRPAGKRDAVVTIKGLHPNTRDEFVLAYLNKFAKSVTNKVIHGIYADGPLKGFHWVWKKYTISRLVSQCHLVVKF